MQIATAVPLLMLFPVLANAQSWNSRVPADTLKTYQRPQPRLLTFEQLDQRKVYHWGNGQASTPTGRQAGSKTSDYVMLFGDSAVVVNDPYRK